MATITVDPHLFAKSLALLAATTSAAELASRIAHAWSAHNKAGGIDEHWDSCINRGQRAMGAEYRRQQAALSNAGKLVLSAEYKSKWVTSAADRATMCASARAANLRTLVLPLDLNDKLRYSCDWCVCLVNALEHDIIVCAVAALHLRSGASAFNGRRDSGDYQRLMNGAP